MISASSCTAQSAACSRTILFAGGGSGGHIAPGLAIAERLNTHDSDVRCLFACSNRSVDAHMLTDAKQRYNAIDAAPLSKHPRALIQFALHTRRAIRQAQTLIRTEHIGHVALLGGFVAAPVAWAATGLGIPTTLINFDIPPGKANRWIARRATNIISAVPVPPADSAAAVDLPPPFNSTVVPTPVRRRAIAAAPTADCRQSLGLDPDKPTLLITGASQGSTSINQFLAAVVDAHPEWFAGWQILHLAGRDDPKSIAAAYDRASIPAVVLPFLDDVGLAWGAATVAISRAGANSVAEILANNVPTLFLPYPWHADQHQRRNAQPLADYGAAIIADDHIDPQLNLTAVGPTLRDLLVDMDNPDAMRRALAANNADSDGASIIAQHLCSVTPIS